MAPRLTRRPWFGLHMILPALALGMALERMGTGSSGLAFITHGVATLGYIAFWVSTPFGDWIIDQVTLVAGASVMHRNPPVRSAGRGGTSDHSRSMPRETRDASFDP